MPKLIPFFLIPKSLKDHPAISLLIENNRFSFDEPNNIVNIPCEAQIIIPEYFSEDPIFLILCKNNLFDFKSENNIIYLPINPQHAKQFGLSPYGDPPLDTYLDVIRNFLKVLKTSSNFVLIQSADQVALKEMSKAIHHLQSQMAEGLKTGKLFSAPSLGPPDPIDLKNYEQYLNEINRSKRSLKATTLAIFEAARPVLITILAVSALVTIARFFS